MIKQKKPYGLGGWMIIPIFNLFGYGLLSIITLFILPITSIISIGLTIYVLYLMFKFNKSFPKLFIIWLWVTLVLNLIQSFLLDGPSYVGYELFFNIIWTRYMFVSKRVKNTFIKNNYPL